MTGLLHNKYRIAVYDPNIKLVREIIRNLNGLVLQSVVIQQYTDSHEMFIDLNVGKAKNVPFDIAIIGPTDGNETHCILQRVNPNMEILLYDNKNSLINSSYLNLLRENPSQQLTFAHL